MFNSKASSGPMMLLKSLGFDPQAMIAMFQQAQQIVMDFAKNAEDNHAAVMMKLELIHCDVKSLNPDHAGSLGTPVSIEGDAVTIGEELAVKIDREHFATKSLEYESWATKQFDNASEDAWLGYRYNERRTN